MPQPLQHIPEPELAKHLENTPVDQIHDLIEYSESQATWHAGYAAKLRNVIERRRLMAPNSQN